MKEMVPRMLKDMSSYKEISIHLPAKKISNLLRASIQSNNGAEKDYAEVC